MNHLIFFEDVFPSEKFVNINYWSLWCLRSRFLVFNIFLRFFFSDWWLKHHLLGKNAHPFQRSSYSLATKGSEKSLNQLLDETSNIFCVYTFTLEMMIQFEATNSAKRRRFVGDPDLNFAARGSISMYLYCLHIYIYTYTDSLCETLAAKKYEAVPDLGGRNKGCFLVSDLNLSA